MKIHDDARDALDTIAMVKNRAARLANFAMKVMDGGTTKLLLIALLEDAGCQLAELGFPVFAADTRFGSVAMMIEAAQEDWKHDGQAVLRECLDDYFYRVAMNAEQALPSRFEEMREHSTHWGL